ncbi:hypothetical protein LCGC14_1808140, partial [marine sediment metagenome]
MGHGAASGNPMPDATFLKISGAKLDFLLSVVASFNVPVEIFNPRNRDDTKPYSSLKRE